MVAVQQRDMLKASAALKWLGGIRLRAWNAWRVRVPGNSHVNGLVICLHSLIKGWAACR